MIFFLYKMIFYLLICNSIFIPIIFCSNTTVSKSEINNNTLSNLQHEILPIRTKGPLPIEGGSISPETLITALSENNDTKAINDEASKNKVVARKGVIYPGNITKSAESEISISGKHTIKSSTTEKTLLNDTTMLNKNKNITMDILNKDKAMNITKVVKKPLILNYEMLERQTDKASPETLANNLNLLPNKDMKSYVTNATKHPGMVMPIVITILLVPMFAVLGYMALRRGQEAWKNRHYKRMDFLLDGMYND